MHWKELFLHPIVREAVLAVGDDPDKIYRKVALTGKACFNEQYVRYPTDKNAPSITIDREAGSVIWQESNTALNIEKKEDRFVFSMIIYDIDFPESIVSTMIGEDLSDFIAVPGSDAYRVTWTERTIRTSSTTHQPIGTRIELGITLKDPEKSIQNPSGFHLFPGESL